MFLLQTFSALQDLIPGGFTVVYVYVSKFTVCSFCVPLGMLCVCMPVAIVYSNSFTAAFHILSSSHPYSFTPHCPFSSAPLTVYVGICNVCVSVIGREDMCGSTQLFPLQWSGHRKGRTNNTVREQLSNTLPPSLLSPSSFSMSVSPRLSVVEWSWRLQGVLWEVPEWQSLTEKHLYRNRTDPLSRKDIKHASTFL